jgi:lipoprotein NlpI
MPFFPSFRAAALGVVLLMVCSAHADPMAGVSHQQELRAEIEAKLASFQLRAAEAQAEQLSDPGYRAFYKSHVSIYKYVATQDPLHMQNLRLQWDAALAAIDRIHDSDPLKQVMLSELYCKRAILEFMAGNYLTAVRYTRSARSHIRLNEERFPANIEQKKIQGLFHVLLGAVPTKYQWVTNMLGYSGNVSAGVRQLEVAASGSTLLRTEAQLILYYVQRNMLNQNEKAIQLLEAERTRSGPNILLDFLVASARLGIKQNEQALALLSHRDQYVSTEIFFIPYWDYMLGKAYYYKNDLGNAQKALARFLKSYKGQLFRTDANFRLGMALSLSGSYATGKHFFDLVVKEAAGNRFDEDEYAAHMAARFAQRAPNAYELDLFRARNLFDGGYYERAIALLKQLDLQRSKLQPAETAELNYRYGRIYHSQGKLDLAVSHYRQCTQVQAPEEAKWFTVFSYYYMGEIARQLGNKPAARVNFEKALSYNNYFYQSGLENRCKIALSQLK